MRENRPYGLEGGESGKPDFPTLIGTGKKLSAARVTMEGI